jgi:hypothetical protein
MTWCNDLSYWSYGRGYGRGHFGTPNYNYWEDVESTYMQTYPCIYPWCTYGINFQLYSY